MTNDDGDNSTASRITPRSLWTDGLAMFDAAAVLILYAKSNREKMRLLLPIYYLLGHGIEVTLKAVLLENGSNLEELKDDIKHNLERAAHRVVNLNLDPLSGFVKSQTALVQRLNRYYSAKVFEYRKTGHMRPPPTEELAKFLSDLSRLVNRCLKK
jgi:hypothetical protein